MARCQKKRTNGGQCKARPRAGSRFCPFHDPALTDRQAQGRQAGGRTRSRKAAVLPADAKDLPLRTAGDVAAMLATTINQTRKGELDPKVANAVGYLAGALVKALQETELQALARELAELKETMAHANRGDDPPRAGGAEGAGPEPATYVGEPAA